ncbi:hypothetical protein CYMTET_52541 [Cymbomonas tetramitiformis]|uniref:Uncharacterized protein n=1 Tax=Cymbomonas tetramitiformis TaxID=36881 RepID=A0AAE0BK83_9CHLO|nr:hypothetical protein CYMTET_52541 [Cymbomonas tetramitiformis]
MKVQNVCAILVALQVAITIINLGSWLHLHRNIPCQNDSVSATQASSDTRDVRDTLPLNALKQSDRRRSSFNALYGVRKPLNRPGFNLSHRTSEFHTLATLHEALDADVLGAAANASGLRGTDSAQLTQYQRALQIPRPARRYFIAALLHNSFDLAPTLLAEVLKVVLLLRTLGHSNVFVSIYESGSGDMTALALFAFREHLADLGVPHRVTTQGRPRKPGEHRIAFLAHLRNLVLEPLYTSQRAYDQVRG